jgi:hypothetical protein
LERTVLFLGIHKWEPYIYIGFSPALHLQCGIMRLEEDYEELTSNYEAKKKED